MTSMIMSIGCMQKVVPINSYSPKRIFVYLFVYLCIFCVFSFSSCVYETIHCALVLIFLSFLESTKRTRVSFLCLNRSHLTGFGIGTSSRRRCCLLLRRRRRESSLGPTSHHATLPTCFFTALEFPFHSQLGDPLASSVLKVLQKVGIPTSELTNHRSLLDLCLARRHYGIGKLGSVGTHQFQHVPITDTIEKHELEQNLSFAPNAQQNSFAR